jgi:hypothetical protein
MGDPYPAQFFAPIERGIGGKLLHPSDLYTFGHGHTNRTGFNQRQRRREPAEGKLRGDGDALAGGFHQFAARHWRFFLSIKRGIRFLILMRIGLRPWYFPRIFSLRTSNDVSFGFPGTHKTLGPVGLAV